MFINPDDRRLGSRRQQLTRQRIDSLLDTEKRRRRGMSQFSQIGAQERLARGRRSPFRGSSSGIRSMMENRGGGFASLLQGRGFGRRADEKDLIDTPNFGIPRVSPPTLPGTLPGDPSRTPMAAGTFLDTLRDQQSTQPLFDPSITGGGAPQTPVGLGALTGLVPLGGGTWFDPTTGTIYGSGSASAKVM